MAQFALLTPTTVVAGATIPYNTTIIHGCCNIKHREGSGIVTVKGGTGCKPNVYKVNFHANVTGFTGQAQLGIYLDGELLPETVMSIYTGLATVIQSVDAETEIKADCCCDSISVRVIEGDDAVINTASIIVQKESVA